MTCCNRYNLSSAIKGAKNIIGHKTHKAESDSNIPTGAHVSSERKYLLAL